MNLCRSTCMSCMKMLTAYISTIMQTSMDLKNILNSSKLNFKKILKLKVMLDLQEYSLKLNYTIVSLILQCQFLKLRKIMNRAK